MRVLTATAILLCSIGAALVPTAPAYAFELALHAEITREGLGSSFSDSFLRPAVRRNINHQHAWMDASSDDEKHFDDCEFDGGAAFIRQGYQAAGSSLVHGDLWDAMARFGRVLHTAQDFYSHSNWVELGFPQSDSTIALTDLVDLSGAQSSLSQRWSTPPGGELVRPGIILGADEWGGPPSGGAIWTNQASPLVPIVVDALGETLGRLLVTGKGAGDDECEVSPLSGPHFSGISHGDLNKDCPTCGSGSPLERSLKHLRARALATLQTSYEWCRLVREAALSAQDGLLLALWVRPGGNPHPPKTPCRPQAEGPVRFIVTIDSIRILNAKDGPGDPGEIQLAIALYDDPFEFHRSVHVTNKLGGRMALKAGEFVPANQLPGSLVLCVSEGQGVNLVVFAWDNDDPLTDEYGLDFDNYGDDDEVLVGLHQTIISSGESGRRIADLEVRYHVTKEFCQPEIIR